MGRMEFHVPPRCSRPDVSAHASFDCIILYLGDRLKTFHFKEVIVMVYSCAVEKNNYVKLRRFESHSMESTQLPWNV
jgi:hypothetical protein